MDTLKMLQDFEVFPNFVEVTADRRQEKSEFVEINL